MAYYLITSDNPYIWEMLEPWLFETKESAEKYAKEKGYESNDHKIAIFHEEKKKHETSI